MTSRIRSLARPGLLAGAALLGAVACATTAATPTDAPTPPPTSLPSVAASVAASVPATVATERPGPTPIVGDVAPAPELVDLVTGDGAPFSMASLAGHPTLLFFGYTHCPDVCPATLGELIGVLQARPDARVVFVTVDPERDTPEFLAEWTAYLPEGLVGVTGSPLAIRHAADGYGARYARVDTESAAGYAMSHTAFQYLIDGEGNLVLTYPFGTPAAAIIGDLDALDRAAPTPSITVEGAWARVSPMVDRVGAAYLVIRNGGETEDTLVSVASTAARVVELHETRDDGSGQMQMSPVGSIVVPAGGTAELKPGSLHAMLIDLVAPLEAGGVVDLMLAFQSGTTVEVAAEVRATEPMSEGSLAAPSPGPIGHAG